MQRSVAGYRALPVISYESVFVYCLAIDLGLVDPPRESDPTCCRGRHESRFEWLPEERQVGEFCVHFAMLLVRTKCVDDIRDAGRTSLNGIRAWLGHRILRRRFRSSQQYFDGLDSEFQKDIDLFLREHDSLEQSASAPHLGLYVQPTAKAFARVFGLLPKLIRPNDLKNVSLMEEVGTRVGAAIIAFDCAVDWASDQRTGEYNPLEDTHDVVNAFDRCIQELVAAGWVVAESVGRQSVSSRILRHQVNRVISQRSITNRLLNISNFSGRGQYATGRLGIIEGECCACCCEICLCPGPCGANDCSKTKDDRNKPESSKSRRKRRKKLAQRKRGGDCDCGCDCDCIGLDCCGDWSICDSVDACVCDCCSSSNRRKDRKQDSNAAVADQQDPLVGCTGKAVTLLAPFGTIAIDGQEHPAKSQGQPIEASSDVTVISREAFGYVVKETESSPS